MMTPTLVLESGGPARDRERRLGAARGSDRAGDVALPRGACTSPTRSARPGLHVEGTTLHLEGGWPDAEVIALPGSWDVNRWDGLNLFFGGVQAVERRRRHARRRRRSAARRRRDRGRVRTIRRARRRATPRRSSSSPRASGARRALDPRHRGRGARSPTSAATCGRSAGIRTPPSSSPRTAANRRAALPLTRPASGEPARRRSRAHGRREPSPARRRDSLLDEAVGWAREAGFASSSCTSSPGTSPRSALYESFGFEREGYRKRHYERGGEYVDAILMAYSVVLERATRAVVLDEHAREGMRYARVASARAEAPAQVVDESPHRRSLQFGRRYASPLSGTTWPRAVDCAFVCARHPGHSSSCCKRHWSREASRSNCVRTASRLSCAGRIDVLHALLDAAGSSTGSGRRQEWARARALAAAAPWGEPRRADLVEAGHDVSGAGQRGKRLFSIRREAHTEAVDELVDVEVVGVAKGAPVDGRSTTCPTVEPLEGLSTRSSGCGSPVARWRQRRRSPRSRDASEQICRPAGLDARNLRRDGGAFALHLREPRGEPPMSSLRPLVEPGRGRDHGRDGGGDRLEVARSASRSASQAAAMRVTSAPTMLCPCSIASSREARS